MDVTVLTPILVGVFSGFLGSLMGFGGGVFIVPFLTLFENLPIHQCIPSSLIAVIATSITGGSSYIRQGITNIKLAFLLEVSTTLGALIGGIIALFISSWSLFIIFSILLFYISISAFRTRGSEEKGTKYGSVAIDGLSRFFNIKSEYYDRAARKKVTYAVLGVDKGLAISFLAGIGSGLLGIGGGAIKVGAMNVFMNVPIKVAVGTSQFMLGATASTSAVLYLFAGLLNPALTASLCIGTIIGTYIGSNIMNRFRSRTIKLMIALFLSYLAYMMLAKGLLLGFGLELPTIR